jgi:hypothetical protein
VAGVAVVVIERDNPGLPELLEGEITNRDVADRHYFASS